MCDQVLKTRIPKISELQEEIAIIILSQYPSDVSTPNFLRVHNSNLLLRYTKHIKTKERGSITRQLEWIREARNCFMMRAMVMKSGFIIFHCTAIGRY